MYIHVPFLNVPIHYDGIRTCIGFNDDYYMENFFAVLQ